MAPPTWPLGLGDEIWWRRVAQPKHQGGPDAEAPDKRQALHLPTAALDPKARAWYGLRRLPGLLATDPMGRRFVTGRPVRAGTLACLAWGSPQRAAQGCTALLVL